MRHLILLCASVLPLVTFVADEASAQRRFRGGGFHGSGFHGGGFHGGGFHGGGFHGGGFRPGIRPEGFRPAGVRPGRFGPGPRPGFIPGRTRWQVGPDRWRRGWRPRPYYPRPYVRPAYWGGYYPGYYDGGWGWGAAGLATGVAIGAAAASTYPAYATPVQSSVGGYCTTPVRTCALINPAPVGTGCSCRVSGGRARGSVVGP